MLDHQDDSHSALAEVAESLGLPQAGLVRSARASIARKEALTARRLHRGALAVHGRCLRPDQPGTGRARERSPCASGSGAQGSPAASFSLLTSASV